MPAGAAVLCFLCCRPAVLTHRWPQGGARAPSKRLWISQLDRGDVTSVWRAKATSTMLLACKNHMTCLPASIIMLLIFSVRPPPKDVSIHLSILLLDKSRVVEESRRFVWAAKCKNMSCPNNSANFLMDPLMGGSSSFRDQGCSSNSGMYIHTAAEFGYSVMRNIGKLEPSPLFKPGDVRARSEALSGFQDAPYLPAQLCAWTPGTKGCRDEQPVAPCLQPYSFPAGNVKEEAFCCLYQDGSNEGKQAAESPTYIRLGDNGCGPEQTATQAGGCVQMYEREEPLLDDRPLPSACSVLHLGTEPESTISGSKFAKETTTDERKEEKTRSDGCSEASDNEELKGRAPESQIHWMWLLSLNMWVWARWFAGDICWSKRCAIAASLETVVQCLTDVAAGVVPWSLPLTWQWTHTHTGARAHTHRHSHARTHTLT